MKQLIQNLKSGKMELLEVPFPVLSKNNILVRNHFSLISTGTEKQKVIIARSSLISKAKEKPEQVKQVLDSVKTDGFITTYKKVMNKLNAPSPLGYSCAGEVIDVGTKVTDVHIGDYVACGGDNAAHAEVVSIPRNLCVKVPKSVRMEHAAFTTVASIALQGARQADLKLGESCVVIGLGLIGQLTVQILKASGIKVIGIDIDPRMVDLALTIQKDSCFQRDDPGLESHVINFTNGFGTDAAIITAGTKSLDPVELAGKLCRKRGKVVIVGAVPTGFSRENYYKKELSLLMSCSYGPGRYDTNYEEKGTDYPIGYVRWTENRNMQSVLDLVADKKMNLDILTTHVFNFKEAIKAFQMIMSKNESYVGILLQYDIKKEITSYIKVTENRAFKKKEPNLGFIGAGSFAQKYLLPAAKKYGNLIGVSTAVGHETRNVADKYGFEFASGKNEDIFNNKDITTVFIATRHDLHADLVIKSLKSNKNVFVEKPLCMTEDELEQIRKEYEKANVHLMVGFNRRFAPFTERIIRFFGKETKKAMHYRINAGFIPPDHWIQDKEIGGGRIIGEVCHFIDIVTYIAGVKITDISAFVMDDIDDAMDTLTINLNFANGTVASISYFANGSKALKKEHLEVYSSGRTAVINDFKEMQIYGKRKRKFSLFNQDKGYTKEVEVFLKSIKEGTPTPIPFEDIYSTTKATFKVIESIKTKSTIRLQ